jgi:ribulose-5-phosphate 4-epimerase/fuculose-1-phosphate aldolase
MILSTFKSKRWAAYGFVVTVAMVTAYAAVGIAKPESIPAASIDPVSLELAQANRILASEGILDALGHMSVRDPNNPKQFLITRQLSAALVRPSDIVVVGLDGEAVEPLPDGQSLFWERFIHAAIYESRPDVVAVLHAHTPSVLPLGVSSVPFRPVVHNAAVLGESLPVWDMRHKFGDTNLLVMDMKPARDLATCVGTGSGCLMRSHGVVIVARSIKELVWYAMAMDLNAKTLLAARTLGGTTTYLSKGEIEAFAGSQRGISPALQRQWNFWLSRADLSGI